MTLFRTPTRFSFFEQKNIFATISPKVPKMQNIVEIFWKKTFGDIRPPCTTVKSVYQDAPIRRTLTQKLCHGPFIRTHFFSEI
jgi:hypothetical protein